MSDSILVSACLLGQPCRYDASAQPCPAVLAMKCNYELIPVCPEQLGGLPTPRPPAEIQPDGRIVNREGDDVTEAYRCGADAAVAIAQAHGCKRAVLKSRSPSCGAFEIHDGSFSGTLKPGQGMAASALRGAGIVVTDEKHLPA